MPAGAERFCVTQDFLEFRRGEVLTTPAEIDRARQHPWCVARLPSDFRGSSGTVQKSHFAKGDTVPEPIGLPEWPPKVGPVSDWSIPAERARPEYKGLPRQAAAALFRYRRTSNPIFLMEAVRHWPDERELPLDVRIYVRSAFSAIVADAYALARGSEKRGAATGRLDKAKNGVTTAGQHLKLAGHTGCDNAFSDFAKRHEVEKRKHNMKLPMTATKTRRREPTSDELATIRAIKARSGRGTAIATLAAECGYSPNSIRNRLAL